MLKGSSIFGDLVDAGEGQTVSEAADFEVR
jgi:hypothetical protein